MLESTCDNITLREDVREPRFSVQTNIILVLAGAMGIAVCIDLAYCFGAGLFPLSKHFAAMSHDEAITLIKKLFILPTAVITVAAILYLSVRLQGLQIMKWAAGIGAEYVPFPSQLDGFDMTVGSVIAQGAELNGSWSHLLSGERRDCTYRVIDYGYMDGKYKRWQTVICIDLQPSHLYPFSIVHESFLDRAFEAEKLYWDQAPTLPDDYLAVISEHHTAQASIPTACLIQYSYIKGFNIEYLGDRLLVYRDAKILTGNQLLKRLDYAIAIAKTLR